MIRKKYSQEATYNYQLREFYKSIRENKSLPTTGDEMIRNMKVIDAIYQKAGLKVRGT